MTVLDLSQPLPDRAHEAIRAAVVQAIANLGQTSTDLADGFDLTDVAFELIDAIFTLIDAVNIRCDALQIDTDTAHAGIDALQARVADLEAQLVPLPGPDAAG